MKRPSETLDLNAFEKFITAVGEYGHAQHQSKSLKERFFGEKHGEELVNLSREYGRPLPEPARAVAWLKTTIASDSKQAKKVNIGWTRELWVFVNGKLVYADKNLFEQEGARKTPDGRCSLENGAFTLPLEAGDNEIAVAIANKFFGWGLMLRLADAEGVHLAAK